MHAYTENAIMFGGPQALPTNWRDKGDISGWSAEALRAEGWLPIRVIDNTAAGQIVITSTFAIGSIEVVETRTSRAKTQAEIDAEAESARLATIDTTIGGDTVLAQLRAMTNAQFDTWWSANVSTNAQAIAFMKRLARVVIRRVL